MNYETDIISIVSKLQVNHELKTAQSINEIVINPWLVACTWKLLNFKRMISKIRVYIEDITRWREDMNFIFEWQNNTLRTSAASELNIVFATRK